MTTGQIAPEVLDDVVRRIVAAGDPDRIILFGSAARGTMGPRGDLDLLVIKGGDYKPGKAASSPWS